ncbi:MAG TPA: glycosyltransferase family 2 protein [Longimicrobiales bacterium]
MRPNASLRVYILNWNSGALGATCLDAVLRSTGVRPDPIVIDNASTDGSRARLAEMVGTERVIALGENRGYAGGMNVALEDLRRSGLEYGLLLTQDVIPEPDALARLVDAMCADPGAGVVGPVIVYRERPERILGAGGIIDRRTVRAPCLRTVQRARPYPVDWLDGCCLLVRSAAAQAAGGFDEAYFMYYEETDFCHRVRRRGWSAVLAPDALVHHDKSAVPSRAYYFYMTRNRYRFWQKNFGIGTPRVTLSVAEETARVFASWMRSLLVPSRWPERTERYQRLRGQARGAIAGTAAHLRGRYGPMQGRADG